MKRTILAILLLTLAVSAWANSPSLTRILSIQPKVTALPAAGTVTRPFVSYSSSQGKILRLADTNSVLELGGIDTTAADGTRYVVPYNSVAFSGTPSEGMLQTSPTGLQIYLNGAWGAVSTPPSPMGIADLTDWPTGVSSAEVGFLNGVTGPIQDQIAALAAGNSGYVAAPTYSDSTCSVGQWSVDSGYHYVCRATNTWDRAALSAWSAPTPDTTPAVFTFTDVTDVALSTETTSAPITVTGINTPAAITVTGGTYDINASGTFVSTAGTVSNNDTVRARHTSSGSNSTATDTIVTIGGVSDTFTSTTEPVQVTTYTDTFNGTESALFSAGNQSTGSYPANWTILSGTWRYISNTVREETTHRGIMYWSANTFIADHFSECVNPVLAGPGPAVRVQATTPGAVQTAYYMRFYTTGPQYEIIRVKAGTETTLRNPTTHAGVTTTAVTRLAVSGTGTATTLKFYLDGVLIDTVVDNSADAIDGGYPGLGGAYGTGHRFEDWRGGDGDGA